MRILPMFLSITSRTKPVQRANGLDIPETVDEALDPQRVALLVYDMQQGILSQLNDGAAIAERVGQVLDAARAAGVRVFFLRHLSLPKRLMGLFQLRMAMAWQRTDTAEAVEPWFLRGTPAFEIIPALTPRADEAIFDKITMSAFEGTPLDIALRDCGVVAFAIVGVATEIGIEPTVRHGADLGYIPIVVEDACGAGHAEAGTRAVESMRFIGDALFCTVADIQARWSS